MSLTSSRRTFMKNIALAAAVCVLPGRSAMSAPSVDKTNIILIMADDLGYECLSCNGAADYNTPNLDRLAAEGMRFTRCYSQPLCTPSRVQIMTGRYNHRNYDHFGDLDTREITFGNLLKDAGYATCISGKWQLGGKGDTVKAFGFDEYCLWNMLSYTKSGKPGPSAWNPANNRQRYKAPVLYINGEWHEGTGKEYGPQVAADFLCSFVERNKDKPFLCYYPMILTHSPFEPTPDSKDGGSKGKANFVDMVAYMDKIVGQIVAQLEKSGVLERTLILFTGDNGTDTSISSAMKDGKTVKGGKGALSETGTHVPLVAYWKGVTPKGVVSDDLVDFSDFLPTCVEAAGAALPGDRKIDGVSFLPQLKGKPGNPREWVFFHYSGKTGSKGQELIMDKRYKLDGSGRFTGGNSPDAQEAEQKLEAALKKVREK